MKFYIETFGCTANFGNSQETADALVRLGHVPANIDCADVVIVNTCAVTARTERKILRRLRALPGDRLVISGCLPSALPDSLRAIPCKKQLGLLDRGAAGEIAALFSQSGPDPSHPSPSELDCRTSAGTAGIAGIGSTTGSLRSTPANRIGIINISEGCSGRCTYCIVRLARGRLASKSAGEVVEQARRLAFQGAFEIELAAQDTASYGADNGSSLPELLDRLASLPGDFMVRVGMMNPDTLMPRLEEMIRALQSPRVFRFLHIPLQSGSNDVLERMGRRYTAQEFIAIIGALRSSLPDITINTDVICGFPGETEEDFRQTMNAVRQVQPDKVNVTRFSPRPGTPAARLYDMPDRIKKERSREMTALWLEIAARKNCRHMGQVLDALVTECGSGATMKARSSNYTGIVVSGAPDLGKFCRIKIEESNPFYLKGVLRL